MPDIPAGLRRTVAIVAALNLAYFGVEFAVAQAIGSVALVADSIDFLEDTSLNVLIFLAVGLSARGRSRAGSVLAFVILLPAVATIWTAVAKIADPAVPDPVPLTVTAFGALFVNLLCAFLLVRHRGPGSLARAAWLSARNDALANVAIIAAAVLSLFVATGWIDIVVGLAIGLMNADAAREVWRAARAEAASLKPEP
jgi:Co/Zn/Cd efflux system component